MESASVPPVSVGKLKVTLLPVVVIAPLTCQSTGALLTDHAER